MDPGERGSVKERVLLIARQRRLDIEHARFLLLLKAAQLDRSNSDEILQFNELLDNYWSLLIPEMKQQKTHSYSEKAKVLEDFSKNFKDIIGNRPGKINNFTKAT